MRRLRLPSTKAHLSRRIFLWDALLSIAAPSGALLLRNPLLFQRNEWGSLAIYLVISFVFCLASFVAFRAASSIPRFFSLHDATGIAQAALVGVAAAAVFTFSVTRLDDIPRSVPAIHLLLLVTGMVTTRAIHRTLARRRDRKDAVRPSHAEEQNIIVVGANKLSGFYIEMLGYFDTGTRRVVGILDENKSLHGRTLFGHTVLGSPEEATALLHDFAMHGTPVSRILICERDEARALEYVTRLEPLCFAEGIELELLANQLGIAEPALAMGEEARDEPVPLGRYFIVKRITDVVVSAFAILVFLPVLLLVPIVIFLESGSPVIFWQRRIGRGGQSIFVYKFRTMLKPIDRHGRHLSDDERRSKVGSFLRATRLDELPQLFSVLNGSMSVIGPRPLLPIDQPENNSIRLLAAPGITGWAQVHGGNLITPDEKRQLDEYYVRHASLRLDLLIVWRTLATVLVGDEKRQYQLNKTLRRAR